MKVYGIKNCDTVKKARRYLEDAGIAYEFHDYKKDGVDPRKLEAFVAEFGWDVVLNRKGTTWRKQGDETKEAVIDASSAMEFMLNNPAAIRRPVVETTEKLFIGFDPVAWELALEMGDLR